MRTNEEARFHEDDLGDLKSVQFEWAVAQTQLTNAHQQFRELRLTALAFTLMIVAAFLFTDVASKGEATHSLVMTLISLWWPMTYFAALILPRTMLLRDAFTGLHSREFAPDDPILRAQRVDELRWSARRYQRLAAMLSQLVAMGVLLTATSLVFISLFRS